MAKAQILPRDFYLDPPDVVARNLLGKLLVRRYETEAAVAQKDGAPRRAHCRS